MAATFRTTRFLTPTSLDSAFDITISGFGNTPVAAIFLTSNASANDTLTTQAIFGAGFTDGTAERAWTGQSSNALSTSNTDRGIVTNRCIYAFQGGGTTTDYDATFVSFSANTVRVNFTTVNATAKYVTCILIGGSDVTAVDVGSIALGTGTSAIDVTAPGFEPTLIFTGQVMLAGVDTTQEQHGQNLGLAHNSGNQMGLSFLDENGETTTVVNESTRTTDIGGQVFGGSQTYFVTVSDYDSSGFSVTPSSNAGSDDMFYLAIKLDSSINVKVFSEDGPTATGDKSHTPTTFTPDFVYLLTGGNEAIDTVPSSGATTFGVSVFDADNQFSTTISSEDGVGTSDCKSRSSSKYISDMEDGSTTLHVGTFTAFTSTGWDANYTTVPGTAKKWLGVAIGPGAAPAGKSTSSLMLMGMGF